MVVAVGVGWVKIGGSFVERFLAISTTYCIEQRTTIKTAGIGLLYNENEF